MATFKEINLSIFWLRTHAYINPVNCVGVSGKGLALEFKHKCPEDFKVYNKACNFGDMKMGKNIEFIKSGYSWPKIVFYFPTKKHWRDKSNLWEIKSGLIDLSKRIIYHHVPSIAIPRIGCGLGGLDWKDVNVLVREELKDIPDLTVFLCHQRNL